ncbi:hypothetical protein SAOR_11690 [Salinisphaera orenii MK-B5]|uniref:Transposase n=1 Tax=Salinisphaera orenii MK-B5 TaxID=856730 RepID=A0A423PK37_9GAMM|nr:hypothetical protein SAOR_11690 [Salinisphaera orenii MK-B5]
MMDRPGDYRWSSYKAKAHGTADAWPTPHPLYQRLGRTGAERRVA